MRSVANTLREVTILFGVEAALGILGPALAILQFKKDVENIQLRDTKLARGIGHMACKDGMGAGLVQSGKEKSKGNVTESCSYLKGTYKNYELLSGAK